MPFAQALELEYIEYENETEQERKRRLKRETYHRNKDKPASKADNLIAKYITYDLYHRYKDLTPSTFPEPSDFSWEEAVLSSI